MDGGSGDGPQAQSSGSASGSFLSPDVARELGIRGEAARERARLDAEVLAGDSVVNELVDGLAASVDGLLEMRWAPRSPRVMAAAVRMLAEQQARLDAAFLALVHAVNERDDVIPAARPGKAAAALLRESLGWDKGRAGREADTARLLSAGGDLAAVGAAFAAGAIGRGHVNVAVGVHGRLRSGVRDAVVPILDPATGEVRSGRCVEVVDATLAQHARVFSVPELARIGDADRGEPGPADPR